MSDTTKPALPEPAAETVMDLFQDHEGPVEALEYLPIGTKLYTADQLRAAIAAERAENKRLRDACAAGWGEPALINTLRAELSTLRQQLAEAIAAQGEAKPSGVERALFEGE